MLGLLWIVTCPLIGEALALWTGLPVPGAVMGVFVMFLCLRAIGRVSECIDVAGAALRRNLPLFVMPAGVSVMAHLGMLQADLVAIVDARQLAVHSAAGTSLAGRFSALPALAADGVPR